MKVLYIAPVEHNDGWGEASRAYARAILTIPGVDLTIRPVYLSGNYGSSNAEFREYIEKNHTNYDILIQKSLPFITYASGKFSQNILLTVTETQNFEHTGWNSKLDILDKILVPDSVGQKELSRITNTPVRTISQPVEYDEPSGLFPFDSTYAPTFKFYFIGEYIDRKNINKLIQAFQNEFSKTDNVSLILKISSSNPKAAVDNISEYVRNARANKIRKYINTSYYAPIQIIGERIPNIYSLHKACDCIVCPSRGEAFARPVAEALCAGNNAIITEGIGTCDYLERRGAVVVKSIIEPACSKNPPTVDLYNGYETWREIDMIGLQNAMRHVYENRRQFKQIGSELAPTYIKKFSYSAVGERIRQCLES